MYCGGGADAYAGDRCWCWCRYAGVVFAPSALKLACILKDGVDGVIGVRGGEGWDCDPGPERELE